MCVCSCVCFEAGVREQRVRVIVSCLFQSQRQYKREQRVRVFARVSASKGKKQSNHKVRGGLSTAALPSISMQDSWRRTAVRDVVAAEAGEVGDRPHGHAHPAAGGLAHEHVIVAPLEHRVGARGFYRRHSCHLDNHAVAASLVDKRLLCTGSNAHATRYQVGCG